MQVAIPLLVCCLVCVVGGASAADAVQKTFELNIMPALACAHAFEERYDLPAPLSYFVTGAAAVVILSFVVAQVVVERAPGTAPSPGRIIELGPLLPVIRIASRVFSLLLFALTIFAGLYGTADPLMNLEPTMVWVIWWVGLSLTVACIGNVWPALDPWRTLFDLFDTIARRAGAKNGIALDCHYPRALGAWPAVVLLLGLSCFEVAYPQAAAPYRLACVVLAWSGVTLAGMLCFGPDAWQRNADVFAVYFAMLGRCAPIAAGRNAQSIALRPPGRGLIDEPARSAALVGFVIAMLSTVLFDGLLSGQAWWLAQAKIARAAVPGRRGRLSHRRRGTHKRMAGISRHLRFDVRDHRITGARVRAQKNRVPVCVDAGADSDCLQHRAQLR